MLNTMLTDEITIVSVATDEWGKQSYSTQTGIKAKVSERNKLVMNSKGKEVVSSMQVIIPSDTNVKNESKLGITKIAGMAYDLSTKEWQIIRISHGHIFSNAFIELWLGQLI